MRQMMSGGYFSLLAWSIHIGNIDNCIGERYEHTQPSHSCTHTHYYLGRPLTQRGTASLEIMIQTDDEYYKVAKISHGFVEKH